MNGGPDESAVAGICPLCEAKVPSPRRPGEKGAVVEILATHFQAGCRALPLTSSQLLDALARRAGP